MSASSISLGFISREAVATSQVPFISEAIPTPLPPPVTATKTCGYSFINSSLTSCAALTIVSDPLTWIKPAGSFGSTDSLHPLAPHLFEEFYRAPNAKAQVKEGTGLGLAITKDLVTRYGGRIGVESKVGEGTTFAVILPVIGELSAQL